MPSPKPSRSWYTSNWAGYTSISTDDSGDFYPESYRTKGWSVSFGNKRRRTHVARTGDAASAIGSAADSTGKTPGASRIFGEGRVGRS